MNEEEAKLILQCRRPCGKDDLDPAMRAALDMLGSDTAAMETMRREERLDAVIGERLRSVTPPADLRRKILLGARVSAPARPRWQSPWWLAAAALLAVGIPVALKYLPGDRVLVASALTDFRAFTTQKLNAGPKLEKFSTMDKVRAYLAGQSKMKSVPVPASLCDCTQGTMGCEVFDWNGNEVTLICFNVGNNRIVHLFTVDAAVLESCPEKAVCVPVNGWRTHAWIQEGKLMMLAGGEKEATEEELKSMTE